MISNEVKTEVNAMLEKTLKGMRVQCRSAHDIACLAYDMYEYLALRNETMNLVADSSWNEFFYRHFLDSVAVLRHNLIKKDASIADIGSGAGFPGIPLKIFRDDISLFSIESTGKKAAFQKELVGKTGLTKLSVFNQRVEYTCRSEMREKLDVVLARAVESISVLTEYSLPLLRKGGKAIFYKGNNVQDEIYAADKALHLVGGRLKEVVEYRVTENHPLRTLVIIEKIHKTPFKYPRSPGVPKKKPL